MGKWEGGGGGRQGKDSNTGCQTTNFTCYSSLNVDLWSWLVPHAGTVTADSSSGQSMVQYSAMYTMVKVAT